MKRSRILPGVLPMLVVGVFLSACGPAVTPTPASLDEVQGKIRPLVEEYPRKLPSIITEKEFETFGIVPAGTVCPGCMCCEEFSSCLDQWKKEVPDGLRDSVARQDWEKVSQALASPHCGLVVALEIEDSQKFQALTSSALVSLDNLWQELPPGETRARTIMLMSGVANILHDYGFALPEQITARFSFK